MLATRRSNAVDHHFPCEDHCQLLLRRRIITFRLVMYFEPSTPRCLERLLTLADLRVSSRPKRLRLDHQSTRSRALWIQQDIPQRPSTPAHVLGRRFLSLGILLARHLETTTLAYRWVPMLLMA